MVRYITVIVAMALLAFTSMPEASASGHGDSGEPEPTRWTAVSAQSAAGLATSALLYGGGLAVFFSGIELSSNPPRTELIWQDVVGPAIALSTPLIAPLAVNYTGVAFGYDTQFLGSHLGGLSGGAVGGAAGFAIGLARDLTLGWMFAGLAVGTVAGSVLGFHLQAGAADSSNDSAGSAQQGLGIMTGWQWRFYY